LVECPSLEDAVARLRQRPQETILLLDGFEPDSPQLEEVMRPAGNEPRFEVIINSPEWEQFAAQRPSASIMQTARTVTSDDMLLECLRKALLRVRTRQVATARIIKTKSEFAEYFALRYQVWNSLGYLAPHKVWPQPAWELDYTDRMSLPFGLFAKADGKLLGAARLVRGFGEEYPQHVNVIGEMLREQGAEVLERNFRYPANRPNLPFDVLQEFKDFQSYYHKLVRRGVAKAEVSRVIVAPDWQRLGLGEVIVDTLCSFARAHSFQVLFLACHVKHAEFYQRCGFSAIPGVTGDHFLTYQVPCLAMERELFAAGELAD
jgi:GNAT superfamily N-acetyltransferase